MAPALAAPQIAAPLPQGSVQWCRKGERLRRSGTAESRAAGSSCLATPTTARKLTIRQATQTSHTAVTAAACFSADRAPAVAVIIGQSVAVHHQRSRSATPRCTALMAARPNLTSTRRPAVPAPREFWAGEAISSLGSRQRPALCLHAAMIRLRSLPTTAEEGGERGAVDLQPAHKYKAAAVRI